MSIKQIDIVHHSHTDFGYTDHPLKARMLQKEYVGLALEAIQKTAGRKEGERFYWTCETLLPVYDWWKEASDVKREGFLLALDSGQLAVMGLAFNITSFLCEEEWDKALGWIPDELWERFKISACMQNDVNGIPRSGIMKAIRKGIRHLWAGPNTYNAVPPIKTPSAFRWQMPDGTDIFVWLNPVYNDGYFLFNENWRQGPVPYSSDLRYRMPEKGDIWRADETSILQAHERCLGQVQLLEGVSNSEGSGGYSYERLLVSVTNQWRLDNDPPFLPITDFVAKWNEMGLKPRLRLTTAKQAMEDIEREAAGKLPVHTGEWTDWWANGTVSSPMEAAISRKAKRSMRAAKADTFGHMTANDEQALDSVLTYLCMFDEHTYGSWGSIAYPYSISTISQAAEKKIYSYRALAAAENFLADRVRNDIGDVSLEDGIHLINSSRVETAEWIRLPVNCLRGSYTHVMRDDTGEIKEIRYEEGIENFKRPESPEHFSIENISHTFGDKVPGQTAVFWSGYIKPGEKVHFKLVNFSKGSGEGKEIEIKYPGVSGELCYGLDCIKDINGWPASIQWQSKQKPLWDGALGEFLSYRPQGFAPRWMMKDIFNKDNIIERIHQREQQLMSEEAVYSSYVTIEDTPYTQTFSQMFTHSSLKWGYRKVTVYKEEPRIRLQVKIFRKSSMDPEVFYLRFKFPWNGSIPLLSNGGLPFRPGEDQIAGSCMDYYAIDGWARYTGETGSWLWSSHDAPLITFERPNSVARLEKLPERTDILLSMIFDNTWDTNFTADSHGIMEFNYDLLWREAFPSGDIDTLVQGLAFPLVVRVKAK